MFSLTADLVADTTSSSDYRSETHKGLDGDRKLHCKDISCILTSSSIFYLSHLSMLDKTLI